MNWLQTLAVVFHVLLGLGIVGLVLLQRGKGADAGAGFGAGASGTVFGARGSASFLSRTTAILAALFFLTSLGLSYLFSQRSASTSVIDRVQTEAPKAPGDTPPANAPVNAPVIPPASVPATAPVTSSPDATLPPLPVAPTTDTAPQGVPGTGPVTAPVGNTSAAPVAPVNAPNTGGPVGTTNEAPK
jgi:preprotein translocase subunit SecG